jgi:hypothetical protein
LESRFEAEILSQNAWQSAWLSPRLKFGHIPADEVPPMPNLWMPLCAAFAMLALMSGPDAARAQSAYERPEVLRIRACTYTHAARPIDSLADLPAAIRDGLSKIAEKGERFNVGDTGDFNLPFLVTYNFTGYLTQVNDPNGVLAANNPSLGIGSHFVLVFTFDDSIAPTFLTPMDQMGGLPLGGERVIARCR